MNYRPEIDGLRAIAVLLVVLFHSGIPGLPGGYIGVDVFFVISGYLITTIIINDQADGRFKLFYFYERRVRRILPALFVVMAATLVLGSFLMWPYQLRATGESVLAASTFVSNFYFWQEIDYFNPQADLHPLLHTWSLAVEEQFYIVFPLLMIACGKISRPNLIRILILVSVLSLAFAQWGGNLKFQAPYIEDVLSFQAQSSLGSFYLPTGRAWELLVGCITALVLFDRHQHTANNSYGCIGIALIIGAAVLYDSATVFPSFATVAPVLGTVLLIVFVNAQSWIGRILASRLLVLIGLASYSIYLWHVPIFVFARIYYEAELSYDSSAALVAMSVALGFLSWRFVEQPFRAKGLISAKQLAVAAAGFWVLLVAAATATYLTNGFQNRYASEDLHLVGAGPGDHGKYVNARFSELIGSTFPETPAKKILVIGDSFAADLINMGFESGAFANKSVKTMRVTAGCQIYIGKGPDEGCAHERHALETTELIAQADVVILAAAWQQWAVESLAETIRQMGVQKEQTLIIFGTKNFGGIKLREFIGTSLVERSSYRIPYPSDHLIDPKTFSTHVPHGDYIDIQRLICSGTETCPVFTQEGRLISYDGMHLTKAGALYAGTRVFSDPSLQALFR